MALAEILHLWDRLHQVTTPLDGLHTLPFHLLLLLLCLLLLPLYLHLCCPVRLRESIVLNLELCTSSHFILLSLSPQDVCFFAPPQHLFIH